MKRHKKGRETGKQKEKMRQTLNIHQLVFCLAYEWTASPLQFIFVLLTAVCSGKVKTWKIGYTHQAFCHQAPFTCLPKNRHTTGTQPQPKIHQAERSSNAACINTAFVLHLRRICCPFGRSKRPEQHDILMLLSSENLNDCVGSHAQQSTSFSFRISSHFKFILNISQTDALVTAQLSQLPRSTTDPLTSRSVGWFEV